MGRLTNLRIIPFVLCVLVLGVGLLAAPRVGPAWDEPDNIFAAGQYANFVKLGFNPKILTIRDPTASIFGGNIFTQEPSLARYPPVPYYIGTIFTLISGSAGHPLDGTGIITVFHMVSMLFLAVLVVTVYQFGLLLGLTTWGSAVAAVLVLLYPAMFGHGLTDLKDTAQVALFTLSLYFLIRSTLSPGPSRDQRENIKRMPGFFRGKHEQNDMLLGAVVWGLAVATKFNAVYVPIIWVLWAVLYQFPAPFFKKRMSFLRPALHVAMVVAIGISVSVLVWPYLWFDPVGRIGEVVRYFTSVGTGYRVFWDGAIYQVGIGRSLWWYPWANILLCTPLALLAAVLAGIFFTVRALIIREKGKRILLLLFLWILIPLARAILPSAAFYDGIRHFMEIVPPLMILAAIGIEEIVMHIVRKFHVTLSLCYFVALFVFIGQLIVIDVTYFPYSAGYFNALAPDQNVLFDRDIEALSVKESIDYLHTTGRAMRIWVPVGGHLSWYYMKPDDQYVYNSNDAQYIVLINKSSHITQKDFETSVGDSYRLIHTITRANAVFARIYQRIK